MLSVALQHCLPKLLLSFKKGHLEVTGSYSIINESEQRQASEFCTY